MKRYFVTIDYDEPKQKTYRGIEVCKRSDEEEIIKRFETGDFLVDWIDRLKWIGEDSGEDEVIILNSSSVDHFIMDGRRYVERPIKCSGENYEISNWDDYDFTAMMSSRMKSFKSLQAYYKKKKKVK